MKAVLILAACLALPAQGQPQCGPEDHVLRQLAQKYHEGVVGRGAADLDMDGGITTKEMGDIEWGRA